MLNARLLRSLQYSTLRHPLNTNRSYSVLPRIVSPSLWQSLIPKALRNHDSTHVQKATIESKPWNPATFFIIIFLVIGSNAINLLAVKQDYLTFSRQADAKIGALREAIRRVQAGEDVDVKKLLGTGDEAAEQEWEDVIRELQQERSPNDTRAARRAAAREAAKADAREKTHSEQEEWIQAKSGVQTARKAEFY